MPSNLNRQIFKKGSRTYYYSSIFFPESIKHDVFSLYAFVRVPDDYVDSQPQDAPAFKRYHQAYQQILVGRTPPPDLPKKDLAVINDFVALQKKHEFDKSWIDAFFRAMNSDTQKHSCNSMDDTLQYMYGSAEVVGLMMAKIMNMSPIYHESAKMLGRSMQYINFIRDIEEDNLLGRTYFPKDVLTQYGLKDLLWNTIRQNTSGFIHFLRSQIDQYYIWEKESHRGINAIPYRMRIPIKTASAMYRWTARELYKDPLLVYCHKIKPSKKQILTQTLLEAITIR